MEVLLAVIGVFTVVFGVVLTFIGSLILHRLKAVEERAKEDPPPTRPTMIGCSSW